MIDITRVVLREITLALKEPFRISSGVTHQRNVLLLQLTDSEGVSGWSECVAGETPHYSPETMETCRLALLSWLAPLLLRKGFQRASDVIAVLDPPVRGHRMAKAALEMAAWALEAERRGISLAALLGGTRSAIEVGISLGIEPNPEALAEKVIAAKREGYRRIKLKIAPGADLAFVRAARKALGPDTPLSVDANAAYQLSDAEHLRGLDQFDLLMIEQPLEGADLRQHAELQRKLRTPLCLDESIDAPARAADMIALGSGKIVNIKSGRVGGLRPAQEIHDLCAQHDIPVWCGGMLETGIGRAHNVALASLPNFRLPGDVSPSARYWERDIVTPEWTMMPDGTMVVPHDRPGLGVAVDLDRIDDLTKRSDELARMTPIADAIPSELREILIALRHDLHQHPELSFKEERTATQLTLHLEAIAPGAVERVAGTGLLARIPGTASGPTVAIRGDIDALPIQEQTGIEFQSIHPGVMHACGHDVHAAWAVGAAHLLAASPAAGDVLILLQPGEETALGAPAVLETGALGEVRAIFGAHVDMRFELGKVIAEPGPIAGATDEFFVEITGRGGHAARPHEARDPIVAAAAVVTALQRIVARRLAPGEPGVVTVGTLHAGTAENIIPESATLTGTLRSVGTETREMLREELKTTVTAVATAYGVRADITMRPGTPPIVNQPDTIQWAQAAVRSLAGDDALVSLASPNLAGEDFAFYLERIPGCFLRIGARAPGDQPRVAHSPRFLPHDDAVLVGAAILAETARRASADLADRRTDGQTYGPTV